MKRVFLFLIVILVFSSCFDDFNNIEVKSTDANFAIPLINTTFSTNDILKGDNLNTSIDVLPNGNVVIKYLGDVIEKASDELFENAPPIPFGLTDTFFVQPLTAFGTFEYKRGDVKTASLKMQVVSSEDADISFDLYFPNMTLDGNEFSYHVDLGPNESFLEEGVSLANYHMDVSNNEFVFRYVAINQTTGERVKLDEVNLLILGLEFSYLEGFLESDEITVDRDTIEIDIYDKYIDGAIYFADPKVTAIVENSFGFPINTKVLVAQVTGQDDEVLALESPFVDDGFNLLYPSLDEVGQSKTTYFEFNAINSNIEDIIAVQAKKFDYHLAGVSNPNTEDSLYFLTDTSSLKFRVAVELPLVGYANNFNIDQNIIVDFSKYDNVSEVEFKLVTSNGFPLDITTQIYFLDENEITLDSLIVGDDTILQSGITNLDGIVIMPTSTEKIISLDTDRFDLIKNTKTLKLRASLSTVNQTDIVTVKQDNQAVVKLGMKVGLNY